MKYRDSLTIQMKMLEVLTQTEKEPHIITRIIYGTETTTIQATAYLADMEAKGLLVRNILSHRNKFTRHFQITEKGRILLAQWMQFKAAWDAA